MQSQIVCRFCGTSNATYARDRYGNILYDRNGNPQMVKDTVTRSYYRCTQCGHILCENCMNNLKTQRIERHVFSTDRWNACPNCNGKMVKIADSTDSSGCFITTATLKSLKIDDDNCYELTTFRHFRDSWLVENYPEDIKEYYHIAPSIVDRINYMDNRDSVYQDIWKKYLQPCIGLIEQSENESAYRLYKQMVGDLLILVK